MVDTGNTWGEGFGGDGHRGGGVVAGICEGENGAVGAAGLFPDQADAVVIPRDVVRGPCDEKGGDLDLGDLVQNKELIERAIDRGRAERSEQSGTWNVS